MNYSEVYNKIKNGSITIDLNGHKFYDDENERLINDLRFKNDSFQSRLVNTHNEKAVRLLDEIQIEHHLFLNCCYECRLCKKHITWRLNLETNKLVATETSYPNQIKTEYISSECSKKDKYKRKTNYNGTNFISSLGRLHIPKSLDGDKENRELVRGLFCLFYPLFIVFPTFPINNKF